MDSVGKTTSTASAISTQTDTHMRPSLHEQKLHSLGAYRTASHTIAAIGSSRCSSSATQHLLSSHICTCTAEPPLQLYHDSATDCCYESTRNNVIIYLSPLTCWCVCHLVGCDLTECYNNGALHLQSIDGGDSTQVAVHSAKTREL